MFLFLIIRELVTKFEMTKFEMSGDIVQRDKARAYF